MLDGTTFDLKLGASSKQFFAGSETTTYGYNGENFWGPTLRWKKGDTITLNVTNGLDEITTTHWHGVHLPAIADGGPHQPIDPGGTWSPSFEVKNNAATFWYHPRMHKTTQEQLTMGAGGFIIVDDDTEASLGLLRDYGVDDIPVVFSSRRFDSNNEFDVAAATAYGDYLLANGVLNAEIALPAQLVRFRILNAEAVGSGFAMKAFNEGMTFGAGGSEPATSGDFGSLLNNTTFDLLYLTAGAATASGIMAAPEALAAPLLTTRKAGRTPSRSCRMSR